MATQATHPPLVFSRSRFNSFEKYTSTRQKAKYKINVANVLVHGKLKKRAEYFASTEENVVSILIKFLENRNAQEDIELLMNATAGHRVARQSLDINQVHNQQYTGHHLNMYAHAEKACADFKAEHLNESVFHTFVEPDQHQPTNTSSETAYPSLVDENVEQYSLKRCLAVRGIFVHKMLAPQEKIDLRAESPGSLDYHRKEKQPVSFIECAGRTSAYSAAWLSQTKTSSNIRTILCLLVPYETNSPD